MVFSAHSRCLWHFYSFQKSRKTVAPQSEIGNLRRLQLKLQFVSDQGDEFGIRRLTLRIADCVSKEALQGVQVTSVPGYFDGVADGTLHTAGCGLECFRHLGVQDLGDGVGVLTARLGALPDALFETYK